MPDKVLQSELKKDGELLYTVELQDSKVIIAVTHSWDDAQIVKAAYNSQNDTSQGIAIVCTYAPILAKATANLIQALDKEIAYEQQQLADSKSKLNRDSANSTT